MVKYSDGSEQFELNFHDTEVPAKPPHPPTLDDLVRVSEALGQMAQKASAPIGVLQDALQRSAVRPGLGPSLSISQSPIKSKFFNNDHAIRTPE